MNQQEQAMRGLTEAQQRQNQYAAMAGAGLANQKKDQGKRPWHLLPWDAVRALDSVDLDDLVEDPNDQAELIYEANKRLTLWFQRDLDGAQEALVCVLRALGNDTPDVYEDFEDSAPDQRLLELAQVTDVLQFGAQKYAPRGWEKGIEYSRAFSAAIRHIYAWYIEGEKNDPETGLSHLAHAACEILFLVAFELRGRTDLDDRPGAKAEPVEVPHIAFYGTSTGRAYFDGADAPEWIRREDAKVYPNERAARDAIEKRNSAFGFGLENYGVIPA